MKLGLRGYLLLELGVGITISSAASTRAAFGEVAVRFTDNTVQG